MGHHSPDVRRRQPRPFVVETLEGRDLPTPPTLYGAFPSPTALVSQDTSHNLTPRGQAKFTFAGLFKGSFTTSPALYQDQASQTFIRAGGTTSATLHANVQAALYTPTDPTAPTTGLVGLFDKNVANSSTQVTLTLTGDTSSLDRAGRPTRFTWTAGDGSGGFGGASGEGTLEVRYAPSRTRPRGATSAGTAFLIIKGQLVTDNGVSNLLTLGL